MMRKELAEELLANLPGFEEKLTSLNKEQRSCYDSVLKMVT